jgi:hypothetical protein
MVRTEAGLTVSGDLAEAPVVRTAERRGGTVRVHRHGRLPATSETSLLG